MMEGGGNRWTNVQGDPVEVSSIEWKSQLHPEARQRIVNKIVDTLKTHLPINGAEGISELNRIAVQFEEKIYMCATSQSDYLRRISKKMLTIEQKTQIGVTFQGDPVEVSSIDWKTQLHPEARQCIVNKIVDTLKTHLPINGAEGISELKRIAVQFEEKIYMCATSQSDYLRKISMKMLTIEQKTQIGGTANPIASVSINENR